MRNDFAVFILTHGRANNIYTLNALKKGNYTGKIYFIIDNEDEQADEYYRLYGDKVIMFDKIETAKRVDSVDNFNKRTAIMYARNECWRIAKDLELNYFLQLDDDFTQFAHRYEKDGHLVCINNHQLDRLFTDMIEWLINTNATTVCLCQGGDLIGGKDSRNYEKKVLRKAMNTFFCRTDRPIEFKGTMNEDVCMYTTYGNRGELLMSIINEIVVSKQTQSVAGGMAEEYKETGTYVKSFYSVITSPNCVKVSVMGNEFMRLHHHVDWERCTVKIINEKWRKTRNDSRK